MSERLSIQDTIRKNIKVPIRIDYSRQSEMGRGLDMRHADVVSHYVTRIMQKPEIVEVIDQAIQNDNRYNNGMPQAAARQIKALEIMEGIVLDPNQSSDPLYAPLSSFFQKERYSQMGAIASDSYLAMILKYLKAKTISDLRQSNSGQEREAAAGKKIDQTSASERVTEPRSITRRTIFKERPEYQAERQVYQVMKRMLVPNDVVIRWEALKQGMLTYLGTPEQQLALMIKEQRQWDLKIRRLLNYSRREDRENVKGMKKIYDKYLNLFDRFKRNGFLPVATSARSMILDQSERKALRKKLRLSDEQYEQLVLQVREEDEIRIKRIKARYEKLAGGASQAVNFSPESLREKAFNISQQIVGEEQLEGGNAVGNRPTVEKGNSAAQNPTGVKKEIAAAIPTKTRVRLPLNIAVASEEADDPPSSKKRPPQLELPEDIDDLTVGIAVLNNRLVRNIEQLARYSFSSDYQADTESKKRIKVGRYIRNAWQRTLFEPMFRQQHERFAADLAAIIKRQAGLGPSVPVVLPLDLVDSALRGGQENKKKVSGWKKFKYRVLDIFNGITAIGQSSQQKLARQWLNEHSQELVEEIKRQSLEEQTSLGVRYASLPKGMNLDEANAHLISPEYETRDYLSSFFPKEKRKAISRQVSRTLKDLIERYVVQKITQDELIREINRYFQEEVVPQAIPSKRKELQGFEIATNILALAEKVRTYWVDYYNQIDKKSGKRRYDQLELKVLVGRGEWGGVRDTREIDYLSRRLIKHLVERQSLRGESSLTRGITGAQWLINLGKDAAIYGGAYLAGGLASARLPPRIALRLLGSTLIINPIGGLAAASIVAGLREGGLVGYNRKTGRLQGIRGRFMQDVDQFLIEGGKGRGFADEEKLAKATAVDQKTPSELAAAIDQLLSKDKLTSEEETALFFATAEAKARLRLTDIQAKKKRFTLGVPLQLVRYTEGENNKEMTHLRLTVLRSVQRLQKLRDNWGDTLSYIQAVDEAQLRFGSSKKLVKQVVKRQFKLSDEDAESFIETYYRDLGVATDKSLEATLKRISKLNGERGRSLALKAAASALLVSGVIVAATEAANIVSDTIKGGPAEYFNEWNEIVAGRIPIEQVQGEKVADLSPIQRAVLLTRNTLHPPIGALRPVNIEGTEVFLPPQIQYDSQHNVLVNVGSGTVVDMSKMRLINVNGMVRAVAERDLTGDGIINIQDNIRAQALLEKAGIKFAAGPEIVTSREMAVLTPTGTRTVAFNSQKTIVPAGTLPNGSAWHGEWFEDNGKFDLIAVSDKTGAPIMLDGGKPAILVNDARFDASGQIVEYTSKNDFVEIANIRAPEILLRGQEAVPIWEKLGTAIGQRKWWQGNELKLDNYKVINNKGNSVMVLDASHMGLARFGSQTVDAQKLIADKQLTFNFSLPHYDGQPIIIPEGADGVWDGKLFLDPDDHIHAVDLAGQKMTIGELSKMIVNQEVLAKLNMGRLATQLRGLLNVFNIGLNGKCGYIEVGFGGDNIFATIQGSNKAQALIGGGSMAQVQLTQKITELVQDRTQTFIAKANPPELPIWLIPFPARKSLSKSQRQAAIVDPPSKAKNVQKQTPAAVAKSRLLADINSRKKATVFQQAI